MKKFAVYFINSNKKSCILCLENDYDTAQVKYKIYNRLGNVRIHEYESNTSIDEDLECLLELEDKIDSIGGFWWVEYIW